MTDLKVASVLAFERKLDPSDALFFSGNWENRQKPEQWTPISIREKSVRGTISNRMKTKDTDPAKLDAKIEVANLQTVDVATLQADADTLKVAFSLRVLGGVGQPSACNNENYRQKLLATVNEYVTANGFKELAQRYAYNLANGRFLWRNRIGVEQIEVNIRYSREGQAAQSWNFNALELSLRNFKSAATNSEVQRLGQVIEAGLKGENYVLLQVEAYIRIGNGQEVFPSQELILDKGNSKKGQKSKTLYQVDGVAAMHSQKIGNAIRTIDTWYPDNAELGPISVEPYGSVTAQGKAYRQPKEKQDFFTLFDQWVIKGQAPDLNNQHYVMAILIRGGVFGESDKD